MTIDLMNILFSNKARKLMSFRSVKVQFGISLLWKNRDQLLNKFSFITVRIWQRFSCNLAYPGWHLILKNDSSDVEFRIAMAEIVDLTGSCLYWGGRLEYFSCICDIISDIVLVITGITVVLLGALANNIFFISHFGKPELFNFFKTIFLALWLASFLSG